MSSHASVSNKKQIGKRYRYHCFKFEPSFKVESQKTHSELQG